MTGIGAAMAGGNPRRGRKKQDCYLTPRDVTDALFAFWKPQQHVVAEPACGNGAMARVIEEYGYDVVASDLVDRGYGEVGVNFLETKELSSTCLITNPPFNLAEEFIHHAFALGVTEMALVLKSTFWHAKRRKVLFDRHRPSLILPLLWRPDFEDLGRPTMEISWFVWDERSGPKPLYQPLDRPTSCQGRLL